MGSGVVAPPNNFFLGGGDRGSVPRRSGAENIAGAAQNWFDYSNSVS